MDGFGERKWSEGTKEKAEQKNTKGKVKRRREGTFSDCPHRAGD